MEKENFDHLDRLDQVCDKVCEGITEALQKIVAFSVVVNEAQSSNSDYDQDAIMRALTASKLLNLRELREDIQANLKVFKVEWPEGVEALTDILPILCYLDAIKKVYTEKLSNLLIVIKRKS